MNEAEFDRTKGKDTDLQSQLDIFNISLSETDRENKKISNNKEHWNNSTNQFDLTDIYRTLYPAAAEYILFR